MSDPYIIERFDFKWIGLGMLISLVVYWGSVLVYVLVPRLFPAHARRHRLAEKPQQFTSKRHMRLLGLTLFNQVVLSSAFFSILLWGHTALLGGQVKILPSSAWMVLLHLILYLIIFDTLYFWAHRLLHTRYLFKKVHSVHHLFRTPFPYCAICVHPLEFVLAYLVPQVIGAAVFGFSYLEVMGFLALAQLHAVHDHCGYAYPWDPMRFLSTQNVRTHQLHHQHVDVNYGGAFTCVWDRLMGTLRLPDDTGKTSLPVPARAPAETAPPPSARQGD